MVDTALSIASVPTGYGNDLVAVAVYVEEVSHVKAVLNAAVQIVNDVFHVSDDDVTTDRGSFPNRREMFHPQLVEALQNLANGRAEFFDVISVIRGRWAGLQAVVVGSNSHKRKLAAEIALAIAAVHDARSVTDNVAMSTIDHFGHCIRRTWVPWKPEIHRHWDLLSRRTVELLLLCQQRRSHGGLAAIQDLLILHVLPFMMPRRFVIW